jgi:adenylate cyclase
LVTDDSFKAAAFAKINAQGYLSSVPERTVRVRIKKAKRIFDHKKQMIRVCLDLNGKKKFLYPAGIIIVMRKGVIDKTRFEIKCGSHIYEVDEFYGENEGLIVEIELSSETETLKDLLGRSNPS